MSRATTAAMLGAIVALTGVVFWQGQQEPQAARVIVVERPIIAPPSTRAEPYFGPPLNAGTTASGAPAPARLPANELGRRLLETKDVKAYVIDALKHPEKGGAFYSALALRQCASMDNPAEVIQRVVAEDSTITAERMNKVNAAVNRCAQFADGEIDALRLEVLRLGKDGRDPIMSMQLQMTKTRAGTPERDALLGEMFQSNSALASENFVPMRLLQQSMTATEDGPMTYRFNGQAYTDPKDLRALDVATMIATCNGADYCAVDGEIAMWCKGMNGICSASREEHLLRLLNGDRDTLARAAVFAEQIRGAMARGDTSIFR